MPMPLKSGRSLATDTESVEKYALSQQGCEECLMETQEPAGEMRNAMEGVPAPAAPQNEVPDPSQPLTPPLQPLVVNEEMEEARRQPLPASAAPSDPQAKRSRIEEPTPAAMTSRMEMALRRIETVKIDGTPDKMVNDDESVMALEEDFNEEPVLEPGVIPDELWSEDPLS